MVHEPPLRAELFTIAQLEQHARTLAGWHELSPRTRQSGDVLLERLDANENALRDAYRLIADAVERGRKITPAAEWLIDNYHLIEEQIRTARLHLPRGYSRELPRLANVPSSGTPRVYDIVHELISHSHGRVDVASVRAFIDAYQAVQPLRLGELWAIPIMLRLALLENLRRVAASITAGRSERELATEWSERFLEVATQAPANVVLVLAELVREGVPLTDPFVSELASRLQGQGSALAFPVTWLDQRLAEHGDTIDHVFARVSQDQATGQVAVSNSIGSLRTLAAIDWRDFVEHASVVEHELARDPSGVYTTMDFGTRDRYRHIVEAIARRSRHSEQEVARLAVRLAAESTERRAHVGWFLVGSGRAQLERAAESRQPLWRPLARAAGAAALPLYLLAIVAITAGLTWWCVRLTGLSAAPIALQVIAIVLLALATSQLAVAVVHWAVTSSVRPCLLPRLDFARGIPDEHKTLVAVPFMLTRADEIDEQLGTLEMRFLANRDANLGFALLTDFGDARSEHREQDTALLQRAADGIAALQERHGPSFWLLHRPRRYNPRERTWMGWERKRGKLEQLNDALRGDASGFTTIVGELAPLQSVRYVIVLDADTQLPRDSAHMLVATLAHPLHRAHFDPVAKRVTEGYAILQPRVGVTMESAAQSHFAALFGGDPGIDPYTRAVSDVYQDLFGEGSFVGKGIYDVDAMRHAVAGRLPENRVLSHDLLEGAYCRAGLVSDVMLFEHYPAAYAADVSRRHRWMRGDWQLTPWLGWRVPSPELGDGAASNPITALSRWKIFDNLRRSVVPVAILALLIGGWVLPGTAWLATLLVLAIWVVPGLLAAITTLVRAPDELSWARHAIAVLHALGRQVLRETIAIVSLPHDAWLGVDAIARTFTRVLFTRRNLLEWRTAADAERSARDDVVASYASTWISPTIAVASTVALALLQARALWVAAPFLVAWAGAPAFTWWLSRPIKPKRLALNEAELVVLRALARRTWHFFERWVGPDDHDLPPDNYQEDPPRGVAHRTSPTNIGLSLTASLAAYDLGYIDVGRVIDRVDRTFATLDRLERFRGHFYNWYDTSTLQPLAPKYVSTVDSGNLSAHLLVLAVGLEELREAPIVRIEVFEGLAHCLHVATTIASLGKAEQSLRTELARIRAHPPSTLAGAHAELVALGAFVDALVDGGRSDAELGEWLAALSIQHAEALAELDAVAPWLALDELPPALDLPLVVSWAELERRETELMDSVAPGPMRDAVGRGLAHARTRLDTLDDLITRARSFSDADYAFLYDHDRRLLSIGYNVDDHRLDNSFYDLLASEARLASFVAIAHGKLPQEHWFSLGRMLTAAGGRAALLSWSGSMFEYLMPLLVMPTYAGTLLDETYRAVVARQIEYGRELGVPWGVSESGYAKTDALLNYQYQAFGVPGLGFKRGLGDEVVIAPYATVMAAMVEPRAAVQNIERLIRDGQQGACGLFEAIDYTPARRPPRKSSVTVRSYMAHHQGMSLLSLAYLLCDRPMQRRFLADPALRATELLLQERVPRTPVIFPHPAETTKARESEADGGNELRAFDSPSTPTPELQLLSNGHYHLMVTNAGGGYSRWNDIAVTRWREDPTRDAWGMFGYLRDRESGDIWSLAHQPTLQRANRYAAIFSHGRAEFRRRDGDIETHVEIAVSPEDDVELRRVTITNHGDEARTIELTTYAEVVLATPAADAAHPAFSNLFVQTELIRTPDALLCTRRPRSASEPTPWMFHLVTVSGTRKGNTSFETRRDAFLGRNHTP
ncbi:MAG TPA: glucoamylase family protein, partial [Nannocystaceae bacterium]|nr:glucoamylase family protein [Nannocystaceae bacterium]